MQRKLTDLHQQRGRLLERIARQRSMLARQMAPVRAVCDATDRILAVAHDSANFVHRHPLEVATFTAALFVMKPRRIWRWLQRGFLAWRSWTALRSWSARLWQ